MSGFLNLIEAAKYLGISKETMYRYLYAEKIPYHRIGKVYRFSEQELHEWVVSGKAADYAREGKSDKRKGRGRRVSSESVPREV